jgi:asparagine synthase (glutamine-hydrolysing)
MSDFLISLDPTLGPDRLVELLHTLPPYQRPAAQVFAFPWGSLAILPERFGKNVFTVNGTLVAWVGDLITAMSDEFLRSLIACAVGMESVENGNQPFLPGSALNRLNGSFAIIVADQKGFCIITDPMNFLQVYMATDARGNIASVGTHSDLVAKVGGQLALDLPSIGEFLNSGTPLFPNTVYDRVKELFPGSVYCILSSEHGVQMRRTVYWSPPAEQDNGCSEAALSEELREILFSIIRDRCQVGRVGVFLSGGLDSRLIMAAVPADVECVGLTFSNNPNRETRTAEKVAACYGREWVLLQRSPDYLADCLVDAVRLTGCEYEWTCGQVIGVAQDVKALKLDVVLEGTLFNDYFTAFCAREWKLQKRWGGLLPSRYRKSDWSYVDQISGFWQKHLASNVVGCMRSRRQQTYDTFADSNRGSVAEWLEIYPFTRDPSVGYWPAERRTLPVRLVAMDRRALDFSFRCPIEMKLGSRLYRKVASSIYGRGNHIPNANDGVRPSSGHVSRLAQRGIHELKRRGLRAVHKLAGRAEVQHSWHDYARYWRESRRLKELRDEYAPALREFEDVLVEGRARNLLAKPDLHWEYGFRLLQLAVWRRATLDY